MKRTWDVNVNGVVHTIQYKAGFGVKVVVNGQTYKTKSQNWFVNMVDYPVVIDGAELRVVAIGNKVDLAVNGVYLGSGEKYVPVHKMPAVANVFIGITCIGGFLCTKWLGLCIGILFSTLIAKQGLKGNKGAMIGAFVGSIAVQIVLLILISFLLVGVGYY